MAIVCSVFLTEKKRYQKKIRWSKKTTRAWTILATSWYGGDLFFLIEMSLGITQINKRSYIRFHVLWWTAVVDVVMPIDFIVCHSPQAVCSFVPGGHHTRGEIGPNKSNMLDIPDLRSERSRHPSEQTRAVLTHHTRQEYLIRLFYDNRSILKIVGRGESGLKSA